MSSQPAAVDIRRIVKLFGEGRSRIAALDGVSLAIHHNEFFTLLGPSGCGKTTLLRLIAGFDQPTSGEISLDGQSIGNLPPFRRPVNTVFQNYALFPHLDVASNIAFGLEMRGMDRRRIVARVEQMLALVRLEGLGGRRPAQLSGGQQQRVALARALANEPRVLLLDEPLSALDLKLRRGMQLELKRLQLETGITFVFVTHDQEEALTMSDRMAVMDAGRVLQTGSPEDIYERPQRRFVADFIGETNFLAARCRHRNGTVQFELADGSTVAAAGPGEIAEGTEVTLAIRPERVLLGNPPAANPHRHSADVSSDPTLTATVRNVVYRGTDTTCHLTVAGDLALQVRVQNRDGRTVPLRAGDRVGVSLPPAAVRVLED